MKTICVISGGMDSTTLLYQLLSEGKEVKAISFDYRQRHRKELEQAKKTCEKLGVEHKIIDLSYFKELASNSALTGDINVPYGYYEAENMKLTVVPNRNMVMSANAIAWAVNLDYDEVALGVHAGDHTIYPDCRPDFIEELRRITEIANFKSIRIYAPFLYKDKGDIVKKGIELGVDYSLTWTCYEGKENPCGKCGACQERKEAFEKAGIEDPLIKVVSQISKGGETMKQYEGNVSYGYENIKKDILEWFSYEHEGEEIKLTTKTEEFTCFCPWSKLPDFATVIVEYTPNKRCFELKSFKMYILSYRDVGVFHEHAVNHIFNDLRELLEPKWLKVVMQYKNRGGFVTEVSKEK